MKVGQKVYVPYENGLTNGLIIKIETKNTGYLWWKEKIDIAMVLIEYSQRAIWEKEWRTVNEYIEIPVSKLIETYKLL